MIKILALVCVTLLSISEPASSQPHDRLTIGMVQFPPDLHPYITATSIKDTILLAVNRPMIGYAVDGSVICELCTEVPSLSNGGARLVKRADGTEGMEVTYTLKPDLYWADGVAVTSADVVFSYQVSRAFNPISTIESAEAVDRLRVKFTLSTTAYDFPRIANSFSTSALLPEHIEGPIFAAATGPLDYGQKSAFNRHPEEPGLWLGPYRVTRYDRGGQITLEPNPYWTGHKPFFQTVVMRLIENTAALQANLLAGDVDTVATGNLGLTLDQVLQLSKKYPDRFDFNFIPSVASYEHLVMNLDNTFLAERRVRQAIAMAIDRPTIVTRLFENRFQVAASFVHPSQAGWNPATKSWPYDPTASKALLADLGFRPGPDGILRSPTGERLSFDLISTTGNRTRELVEQVMQSQLKAIGIEVVIKNQPAREMFGETLRHRTFKGMVLFQTDMPLDYVPLMYFSSQYIPATDNNASGLNYMDWKNPAVDQAIADARAELDPVRRRAYWKIILDQYANDLPEIPLYFPASGLITPKWMTGIYNPERYGITTAWIEDWRAK